METLIENLPLLATNPVVHTVLGVLTGMVVAGVTHDVRMAALKRDKVCQDTSGETHMGPLQFSHFLHDKKAANYNTIEAGQMLCLKHHAVYHATHTAEELGMKTEAHNRWGLKMLCDALGRYFLDHKDE